MFTRDALVMGIILLAVMVLLSAIATAAFVVTNDKDNAIVFAIVTFTFAGLTIFAGFLARR